MENNRILQSVVAALLVLSTCAPISSALADQKGKAAKAATKKPAAAPASPKPSAEPAAPNTGGKGDTPAQSSKGDGNALKQLFNQTPAQGTSPLFIKSDTLELNSKDHVFVYKGNVEIVRNDITITAKTVEGKYDEQNRIQTIVCKENVVITRGQAMRATSNRAVYHVDNSTIEMTEGPELYKEGNALAADKVTVYLDEDRSEAEGNVRVKVIKAQDAT
ncbi:MAG: LptA/OstA family protein [Bdellovibrionota bacterium]